MITQQMFFRMHRGHIRLFDCGTQHWTGLQTPSNKAMRRENLPLLFVDVHETERDTRTLSAW